MWPSVVATRNCDWQRRRSKYILLYRYAELPKSGKSSRLASFQIEWVFDYTNFGWDLFVVVGKKNKKIYHSVEKYFQLYYVYTIYIFTCKIICKIYVCKNIYISYVLLNTTVYDKFHIVNINMEGRGLGYAFRVW